MKRRTLALVLFAALAGVNAAAQTAAPVRLRGTIEKVEGTELTVRERAGEVVTLRLPEKYVFQEVLPICSTNPAAAPAKAITRGTCSRAAA